MYKPVAKNIQELLNNASMPAGRQNAIALGAIHRFLDGIQDGTLIVSPAPVKAGQEKPATT